MPKQRSQSSAASLKSNREAELLSSRMPPSLKKQNKKMIKDVQYLLNLNKEHSELFISPEVTLARRQYRAKHPTEIAFIKCMDGRVHGSVMTNTPLGVIQPWRNLGGKFDLGWFGFAQSMREWVDYATVRGRNSLIVVTYHYARGDTHRGCRGFDYDVEKARDFTRGLKEQFNRVFGRNTVHTVQCGIETDWESLVLHGENGETVDCADIHDASENHLRTLLQKLFSHMPEYTLNDFLPLVQGNITHSARIKALKRSTLEAEHRECVIAVGRGFDWLHEINTALIVGPYDPNLANAIKTAATLVKGNMQDGRIDVTSGKGIVLFASAPYRDVAGPEPLLAKEKARFLNAFSRTIIQSEVPELIPHLEELTVTVDVNTRKLNVLK